MTFLLMWWHWCWHLCHMMPMVPSMAHYIPWVKVIEMRCNITFKPVTLLALVLVSHDANSVVNGTTIFLRLRKLKWHACFYHVTPIHIMWWQQITNGIITFLGARLLQVWDGMNVGMTKCQIIQHCTQMLSPAKAYWVMLQQYRTRGPQNTTD